MGQLGILIQSGTNGLGQKGSAIHQNFTFALNIICRESVSNVAVF